MRTHSTWPPGRTSRWPGDWHRGELADLLTLVCDDRRLAPRGMRTGSIAVLGIEDLVEASYHRVILAGVDADAFPRAPAPDLVLTEDLRSEVNRLAGPRLLQAAPMTGRGALHGTTRDLWQWLEALRSATVEPARFLDLEGQAGVIRPGARADIVLLRKNPLEDIGAVRDIETVILAGAVYDREDLDNLLAGVESAAGSWAMWPRFTWQILNSPIMKKQFGD